MNKTFLLILLTSGIIYSCTKTETTPTVTPPVIIKLSGCDSIKKGLLRSTSDTIRLISCLSITGCDSVRLGILKPNTQDTLRLLSCIKISGCDSIRLDILKPNTQDTLRLLSCIKISGCDSLRLGLIKSAQDLLRLDCNSIIIGKQHWMKENLDVVTYRNGDTIPQVTDKVAWRKLTTGAWCYYENDPANGVIYGKLYNWYAVNDPRGLAPQGWHIPTDDEWTILGNFLGGFMVAGGKMKTTGTTRWRIPNYNATNESGFSGLPGGYRGYDESIVDFYRDRASGYWWSATKYDSANAWVRFLDYDSAYLWNNGYAIKRLGFSVRCIKD